MEERLPVLGHVSPQELIRPRDLTEIADMTTLTIARCRRLREFGVISEPASAQDVVPARVYAHLMDYPRPHIPQGRAVSQESELKWRIVAELARELVLDPAVTLQTVLWVMTDGSTRVAHTTDERAEFERTVPETDAAVLRLPLGVWITRDLAYALDDPVAWARQLATPAQHKQALTSGSKSTRPAGRPRTVKPYGRDREPDTLV